MLRQLTSLRSSLSRLRSLSRPLSTSPPNLFSPFFNPNPTSGQLPNQAPADQPTNQAPADQPLRTASPFGISLRPNLDSTFPSLSRANTQNSNQPIPDRAMDFVRRVVEADTTSHPLNPSIPEVNADVLHIKLLRNNTFITLTDSKGNVKTKTSAGQVGGKLSRYDSEATAEHMGRKVRKMGLKNVVVKVKGFIHFKKKRQAIMAFREGFTDGKRDLKPIVYVEDVTRKAHNGCRLPRRRRV